MKVCKFGGTSMATASSIKQVSDIIHADPERKFVVVSAPGKQFKGDIKVTDLLYKAYAEKDPNGDAIAKIRERFNSLVTELNVDLDINAYIDDIAQNIVTSTTPDYAASRGEYLSALITAAYLGFDFVDAGDIIKFNCDGVFDQDSTDDRVCVLRGNENGVVIPGFFGRMPDKSIKTFSRGGSDITGAIIARGVRADIYENWTDVDGFMVTDPTIVKNPILIDALSYEELRELAYMGATVLHPDSVFPLTELGIPINIRNTFNPDAVGTMILKDTKGLIQRTVTGIAGKKSNTTITLKKSLMNSEVGFCRKVLSVLERHGVSFEHMPSGIDTMSVVICNAQFEKANLDDILEAIRGKVNPDHIEVIQNLALIAVVGHGMARQQGTAAKIFTALYNAGVNVRMIDQGSSEMNIIIGIEEKDYNVGINAIYHAFF